MSARLVYVVGPSGSSKDSLLGWLAQQLGPDSGVAFAQRTITRAVQAGGEQHESIDTAGFIQLREAGAFGMAWEANGLCYGVRGSALPPRADATQVIVNGSRVYLDEARRRFPGLKVVQVTARSPRCACACWRVGANRPRWWKRGCAARSTRTCRRGPT